MDQYSFDFGGDDPLAAQRQKLLRAYGPQRDARRYDPFSQFVNAMISARTKDDDSGRAFDKLREHFRFWETLAGSDYATVLALIRTVTHSQAKARYLLEAADKLMREQGGMDLSYLADKPLADAMVALQRFRGIGPKSAAATLNFSSLRKRVFVLDTHVLRISKRAGLLPERIGDAKAHDDMLRCMPASWDADDLYELHWLMKRLGQTLCTHDWTLCGQCPLVSICRTGRQTIPDRRRPAGPSGAWRR